MKRIITTLILLMGCANFIAQAQNTEYSQSSSGIWFEVRTDSLNPCRYTEDNKIYQADREDTNCEVVTPMGTLSCVKVEAVAKSRIGKTRLTAYYNDTYGFVKMDNTNIDGSRLLVDLVETNF